MLILLLSCRDKKRIQKPTSYVSRVGRIKLTGIENSDFGGFCQTIGLKSQSFILHYREIIFYLQIDTVKTITVKPYNNALYLLS